MRQYTYQARTLDLAGDRERVQAHSDEVERLRRRSHHLKFLVLALVLFASRADAHPLDMSYMRVEAKSNELSIRFELDIDAAAMIFGTKVTPGDLRAEAIADRSIRRIAIASDNGTCTWRELAGSLDGRTVVLRGSVTCPADWKTATWSLPFVLDMPSTFQVLVKTSVNGEERVSIVDAMASSLDITSGTLRVRDMIWSGVEHIGAAPSQWAGWKLPDGIDHILFLVALMLAGGTLVQMLGITTGFTVGHSITLALSALGIVRPPASVIEPLIALSIAFAAAEAYRGRFREYRWQVAAAFGLVHGFGFASALHELDLAGADMARALLGYNLGVELGQVAIVLAIAPLVIYMRKRRRMTALVVPSIAAVICCAGFYWFVERTLL